jgi:glycerol-3-phosphate cytidylyltransferase-like family protein
MIYCFDLDNTLCKTIDKDYSASTPIQEMIDRVNYLYDNDHEIVIFTARGMGKFKGNVDKVYETYYELTESQIKRWGIRYTKLILGKPSFDFFIDDKNEKIEEFKSKVNPKMGFISGSFNSMNPRYIDILELAKSKCDYLVIGLRENTNPLEISKIDDTLNVYDRVKILKSLRCVDDVIVYKNKVDLLKILKNRNFEVRFFSDDLITKEITENELQIPLIYINPNFG